MALIEENLVDGISEIIKEDHDDENADADFEMDEEFEENNDTN